MAVQVAPHRSRLIAELHRLGIEPRLVARAADPSVPDAWFTGSPAAPFWGEVLAALGDGRGHDAIPEVIFGAAAAAHLDRWRAEWEDEQLLAAARALAWAARAHLPAT